MKRLIRGTGPVRLALVAGAVALLLPTPAWANNPDFQLLRYLFLWPAGAVLAVALAALAIVVHRRPASRRLRMALGAGAATVILGWPYVVYTMGLAFDPRYRAEDLTALVPALLAGVAGLLAARRAVRDAGTGSAIASSKAPPA